MKTLYILDDINSDSINLNTDVLKKEIKKYEEFSHSTKDSEYTDKTILLNDTKISSCTGCFSCWLKTPGKCIFRDSMDDILPELLESDLLIFAFPLKMGFLSGKIKILMDRLIPLLLPDFEIINNEFHHKKRYKKYPKIGVLAERESFTNQEDISIIREFFERFCLNFHSEIKFYRIINNENKEVTDVINNI